MLFEGQGNAEEQPEYQIMVKRKGSHCTSFYITSFSTIIFNKTQDLGQSPNNYLILNFLQGWLSGGIYFIFLVGISFVISFFIVVDLSSTSTNI